MGLGGYLMWSAVVRELKQRYPEKRIVLATGPSREDRAQGKKYGRVIESEIFNNNPHLMPVSNIKKGKRVLYVYLDSKKNSYHSTVTEEKVVFKKGGHAIDIICSNYRIKKPLKKCELYFTKEEIEKADSIAAKTGDFITVEPHAKEEYTLNKGWSFERWQAVVDVLCKQYAVIQVGIGGKPILNNAMDMTGKLTFRETAALIGRSLLLLSGEGGLMHAANAVNTKAVIIYGGWQPVEITAYDANVNICADVDCAQCGLRVRCPNNLRCMQVITPSVVIDAANTILSNGEGNRKGHKTILVLRPHDPLRWF